MDGGLDFAVRYPFTDSARKAMEGTQLNGRIVDLGVERVRKAVRGDSSARMLFHESDKKEDVASFAAARMILGHLRNNFLTNRFAVNESKMAHASLDRDGEATINGESVVKAIGAQFGIIPASQGGLTTIDLPAYLKYSPKSPHYRLINRRLVHGAVAVNDNEVKRLIEEAVRKHIERIPLVKDPPDMIKEAGKKLLAELPKSEAPVILKVDDHPPCVAKLLESLGKHENLPHQARWYLATYFLALGTGEEQLVKIFAGAPDYNEKVTRYQVDHIKKKGYSVPSCATVQTYGLCCAVCRIGTPLKWHNLTKERKGGIVR